ncbi:hypothetical protein NG799_01675 [Laspinema sp. D1]|uniref:Uncharacterized protein n=1 Tax=Laspinema palackyanum D2a TaxID=2953684 RepID=A0ABT2MM08_9CYAN|nr:hypothetical protein [Laspinema sp. D2a]
MNIVTHLETNQLQSALKEKDYIVLETTLFVMTPLEVFDSGLYNHENFAPMTLSVNDEWFNILLALHIHINPDDYPLEAIESFEDKSLRDEDLDKVLGLPWD